MIYECSPRVGWVCPLCGSVNAPWIRKCFCSPEKDIHSPSEMVMDLGEKFADGVVDEVEKIKTGKIKDCSTCKYGSYHDSYRLIYCNLGKPCANASMWEKKG